MAKSNGTKLEAELAASVDAVKAAKALDEAQIVAAIEAMTATGILDVLQTRLRLYNAAKRMIAAERDAYTAAQKQLQGLLSDAGLLSVPASYPEEAPAITAERVLSVMLALGGANASKEIRNALNAGHTPQAKNVVWKLLTELRAAGKVHKEGDRLGTKWIAKR